MKNFLRYSFIIFLIFGVSLSYFAIQQGISRATMAFFLIFSTVFFNLTVENLIPYGNAIHPRPYVKDSILTIFNVFLTAKFGELGLTLAFAWLMKTYIASLTIFKSTELGPFWVQFLAVILINEFIRYWVHVAQHKIPALWKFHSVHHSVKEIYSLNTFYTHPLDYFLRNNTAFPITLLIGFHRDAVLMTIAVTAISAICGHSRANFKFGWLNYIFSTNQLHRWHHSIKPKEANNNYGVGLCIWDLVFKTHYLPKDQEAPVNTGLHDEHPYVPSTFLEVLGFPFIKKMK